MKTWNIGNTTVRNPQRLREALQLFKITMSSRPFRRPEQQEYLNELGAVNSRLKANQLLAMFSAKLKKVAINLFTGYSWRENSTRTPLMRFIERAIGAIEESMLLPLSSP